MSTTIIEDQPLLDEARQTTVQAQIREGDGTGGFSILNYLSRGSASRLPGWWSPTRDVALRNFWKESDHLAGALYTMIAKMVSIPFRVVPLDPSNPAHIVQAAERQEALRSGAEFGEGWQIFYSRLIEDLLSADNGLFAEVIGPGDPSGPLTGMPLTLAHLDSARCQRTGDPEYPVIYHDTDGKLYKLHYTRVMYGAQMSSPIKEMFGVGFCAISRCINVAQTLVDILIYKQEKLGSRPYRAIIVTQGGLDPDDVSKAFTVAEAMTNSSSLSRYAKIPVIGDQTIPEANLNVVELSKLPDGFDEETSLTLGMATIALAFGVDARELFPSLGAGSTRADALLQHLKQRGKGPGMIIEMIEGLINFKFLPPHLKIKFDFQDDAEDQQAADIRHTRAQTRQSDMTARVIDTRTVRQAMLEDGEITQDQFSRMELEDGRLENGMSVLTLFYSEKEPYPTVLDLGLENPEDIQANDLEEVKTKVAEKKMEIHRLIAKTPSYPQQMNYYRAEAALNALVKLYEEAQMELVRMGMPGEVPGSQPFAPGRGQLPGGMRDNRMQRQNLATPNQKLETSTSRNGNGQNSPTPNRDEAVVQKEHPLENLPQRLDDALARIDSLLMETNGHHLIRES